LRNAGLISDLNPLLELPCWEKDGLKLVWKMLKGSFGLLGIELNGEAVVCGVCCCLDVIPLSVGTNALAAVTTVVVVEVTVVVVVGVVVVVVVVDVVDVVAVVVVVVVETVGLMTSNLEGFTEFTGFLDFDFINDLNDFRGSLNVLRVGLTTLTTLLVSMRFSLICWVVCRREPLVVVDINDCGVSSAGFDSSWPSTSSLDVSSAIFLKKLFLLRKRFRENRDFLENVFSF